jgi:hypothetical protein
MTRSTFLQTIIGAGAIAKLSAAQPASQKHCETDTSSDTGQINHYHIYAAENPNPRELMRRIAEYAKKHPPVFAPFQGGDRR